MKNELMEDDDDTLKQEKHKIDPIQNTEYNVELDHAPTIPDYDNSPGAFRVTRGIGLNSSIFNSVDLDEDVSHDDGQNALDDTIFRSFLEASGLEYSELNEEQEIMLSRTLNSILIEDDTEATLSVPRATVVQEREMNQQECCSTSSSISTPIYAVAEPLSFWNKKKSKNLIVLFVFIVTFLLVSIPLFLISETSRNQDEDSLKYSPLTITNMACNTNYLPFTKIQQAADYMNERYNLIEKKNSFQTCQGRRGM